MKFKILITIADAGVQGAFPISLDSAERAHIVRQAMLEVQRGTFTLHSDNSPVYITGVSPVYTEPS